MSEAVVSKQSKSGKRWLNLATRILVAIVMFIAVLGLILNLGGIGGVWFAWVQARNAVTSTTGVMTHALQIMDNGLGRVNTLVHNGRQTLTQVNDEEKHLGDRIQANSPVISRLSQLVNNTLAPRIENARTTAGAIRDAVVAFNTLADLLHRLPGVVVPALNGALSALSERVQAVQTAVQDLSATLADVKAGIVAKAQVALMNMTSKIDAALAQVQQTVNKYKATVAHGQDRIVSISKTAFLLTNLSAVLLTLFSLMFALGQALLIYVCWLYVRTGHFPTLRVSLTVHAS